MKGISRTDGTRLLYLTCAGVADGLKRLTLFLLYFISKPYYTGLCTDLKVCPDGKSKAGERGNKKKKKQKIGGRRRDTCLFYVHMAPFHGYKVAEVATTSGLKYNGKGGKSWVQSLFELAVHT